MAAPSAKKTLVGAPKAGGALFRAPLGTALPTTARATPNVAFKSQGACSSDGVKRAIKKAYASLKDWAGNEMAKPRTEHAVSLDFNLIGVLDGDVLETIFGSGAVTVTAASSTHGNLVDVAYKGDDPVNSTWIIDLAYNGRLRRIVLPEAQITTETVAEEFKNDGLVGLPVTLTLYPDSALNYFYDYNDDGQLTA